MSDYLKDLVERVVFTAVESALALLAVELADPDLVDSQTWWAVPAASLLATLKGLVAKKVGNPETASTVSTSGATSAR